MDLAYDKDFSYYKKQFVRVIINDVTIKDKEFEECLFDRCSFVECNFTACRFLNCQFKDCVLSAIKPTDSSFMEVKFSDSKIIGFDWTKAKSIRFLQFNKCQLDYSNFGFLTLPNTKMIKCIVHEADFTEADLTASDFEGTDFEKSRFFKTNLTKTNFKKAINYLIDINVNTLKKAHFSLPEAVSLLRSLDISVEY